MCTFVSLFFIQIFPINSSFSYQAFPYLVCWFLRIKFNSLSSSYPLNLKNELTVLLVSKLHQLTTNLFGVMLPCCNRFNCAAISPPTCCLATSQAWSTHCYISYFYTVLWPYIFLALVFRPVLFYLQPRASIPCKTVLHSNLQCYAAKNIAHFV